MNQGNRNNPDRSPKALPFAILPGWRLENDFPWIPWAVGWLSIFKGVLWLSSDPVVPPALAGALATKFILTLIPYVFFGVGIWNLRRWAAAGLIALSVADLVFYLIFPAAIGAMAGSSFWALGAVLLVFNGPAGNVLILLATPALWKHTGPKAHARKRIETRNADHEKMAASQRANRGNS